MAMAKLKILTVPHPLLRQKSWPVAKINGSVSQLANQMLEFIKKGEGGGRVGVGLSAPQIGQLVRLILVWSAGSGKFLTMINPEIIWTSKRTHLGVAGRKNPFEGCLSVPKIWGKVRRFSVVKVRYQTPTGQTVIRKFKGFTGVVVQHETDHLDGILFTDRLLAQKGSLYQYDKTKNRFFRFR